MSAPLTRSLPTTDLGPVSTSTTTSLLALHGFGGGPGSFADVARRLPRGLRAATLPGHGAVDVDDFDGAVDRVVATVLAAGRPVVLWGYSLGARLALAAALTPALSTPALSTRRALAGLILESGRADADDDARAAVDDERAAALVRDGVDVFFDGWERGPLFRHLSAEQLDRRRALRRHHDARRLAHALAAFSPGRQRDLRPRLPELRLPVLLLCGADDGVYRQHAEHMTQNVAGSRLITLPDCGHVPHLEAAEAVAAAVADFTAPVDTHSREPREIAP